MDLENNLSDCKHIIVVYLGKQELESGEGYLELANCKKCYSTIAINENYREISKNSYVKINM